MKPAGMKRGSGGSGVFYLRILSKKPTISKGDWKTKTVWINGRELTGAIYYQFMQIDPLWEWEDSQANYKDELAVLGSAVSLG